MHLSKSLGMKSGAIIGVALVLGLFWFENQPAGDSRPAAENESIPVKWDRLNSGEVNQWKPGDQSVSGKAPKLFTLDGLIAIYESNGAAAALAAAKAMTGPERASQVLFILTYLARIDPEFVAGELKGAGLDTTHQGFIVDAVMNDWKDGKKALDWATSSFTGDLLKSATGGALRILVRTDPDAALAYLETLPASGSRDQAISDIFVAWGGFNPTAALKLLSGNFPTDDRNSAISCVITGWSWKHPAEAAAWVAAYHGTDQNLLVREVLQQWTDSQPREAYAWLGTLPMGPGRDEGINYLMRREASSDPQSVLLWIELLSEPRLRERMRLDLEGYLKADRKKLSW